MYVPAANAVDDPAIVLALVRTAGFGHFVSYDGATFDATGLPFLVDDELSTVRAHLARANPHWRMLDGQRVMIVVPVADAYVSPSWYPSKSEDPRVVPTWNYEVVHLHGIVRVHDEAAFVEQVVRSLTDLHEFDRTTVDGDVAWSVDDAPADYIGRMLRAIVGIEVTIDRVEAKRKLSQNRSSEDRGGVADGLRVTARNQAADMSRSIRQLDVSEA